MDEKLPRDEQQLTSMLAATHTEPPLEHRQLSNSDSCGYVVITSTAMVKL